jgi:hypothetical protein
MRGNQLETIPEPLFHLDQLRELSLSYNSITEVPPSLKRWSHLECLLLSVNRLRTLSGAIGELRSLKELDLSHNELRHLPPQIVQLTALTDLDISGNQIESFPPDFENLTELQQLKVSFNRLRTLPVFSRSHRRPWISCTGNPYLAVLYYLDDADDDVKFILTLNKNTYKLDKLERKRMKKAEKLRIKALKKDGLWDKHSHYFNEKSVSFTYFDTLTPDENVPFDEDEEEEDAADTITITSPSPLTNTNTDTNTKTTNHVNTTTTTSTPSSMIQRDNHTALALHPHPPHDSEPNILHEIRSNSSLNTPLDTTKKHDKERDTKTIDSSSHPPRRLRHSLDLSSTSNTTTSFNNLELSGSSKIPKSPKKIRDRIQKIREKYNLTPLTGVWGDVSSSYNESTRRRSGSISNGNIEFEEISSPLGLNPSTTNPTTAISSSSSTTTVTTNTITTTATSMSGNINSPEEGVYNYWTYLGWSEMRGRRPDMQDTLILLPHFLDHYLYVLFMFFFSSYHHLSDSSLSLVFCLFTVQNGRRHSNSHSTFDGVGDV